MTGVYIVIFVLSAAGLLAVTGFNVTEASESFVGRILKKTDLKGDISEAKGKKKAFFIRELTDLKDSMEKSGRGGLFRICCGASAVLSVTGAFSSLLLNNVFLAPVLAVVFAVVPFAAANVVISNYNKRIGEELETALSVITNSYLRTEDFIAAVKENLSYIKRPLREVFEGFIRETTVITPDLDRAILNLKGSVNNVLFREWCDSVRACLQDRTLKDTLTDVVAKFTDSRLINNELCTIVQEPRKEYFAMVFITLGNLPLLRLLNKEWFEVLTDTVQGKLILAIMFGTIVLTGFFMIKFTKPIEYG